MSKRRWLKRLKEKESTPNQQCKADQISKDRNVYIKSGIEIDLAKDLRDEYITSQKEESTNKKGQLFWAKISTLLLAIYAGLTLLIYHETQKATANAMRQIIDSEAAQRANLIIEDFTPDVSKDAPGVGLLVNGTIDVTNTGQTTASELNAAPAIWGSTGFLPQPLPPEFQQKPVLGGPSLGPGKTRRYQIISQVPNFDEIHKGKAYWGVTIEVAYKDIFGHPHYVYDCFAIDRFIYTRFYRCPTIAKQQ